MWLDTDKMTGLFSYFFSSSVKCRADVPCHRQDDGRGWRRIQDSKVCDMKTIPNQSPTFCRFFMSTSKGVSLFQISGVWTEFLKVYIRTRKCLLHLKAWTKTAPWDILVINETRAEGLQSLAVTASGWGQKMSNWQGDKKMQNTLGRGGAAGPASSLLITHSSEHNE